MAKLINGNGNPAIYAGEDADLIASLAGNVTCIANVGNKYAATEEDANTIGLADGVIITKEGRRIQLDAGETDLFTIPTGSSGVTNYYIIGYKLVQNADSTQVAETFVQKMNSSSEIITENTFRGGATEVYVSLYRVTQVGFTIDSIDALLSKLLDSAAIKANIAQINTALTDKAFFQNAPVADLNDAKTTGIYSIGSSVANAPLAYGICVVFGLSNNYVVQIVKSVVANNDLWTRTYDGSSTWANWNRIEASTLPAQSVDILNEASYTMPSDGYVYLRNASGETGFANITFNHQSLSIGETSGRFALFVRKGTVITHSGTSSTLAVKY